MSAITSRLLYCSIPQHALDPSDYFVGGWVGGLVEVDDSRAYVALKITLEGRATIRDRSEMSSANKN